MGLKIILKASSFDSWDDDGFEKDKKKLNTYSGYVQGRRDAMIHEYAGMYREISLNTLTSFDPKKIIKNNLNGILIDFFLYVRQRPFSFKS